jgi:Mrp family chromosome partitioning ATPase
MARMREALRQADGKRARLPATVFAPRAYHPDEPLAAVTPTEEEIPFIEVGGVHTPLEASPTVLAVALPTQSPVPVPRKPGLPTHVVFQALPQAAPPLGPVQERFVPELIAWHQPDHPLSEQYRGLVAALEAQLPARQPQVLLFTAATPQTGTTLVLLNLAVTRARQGSTRIVLVDANLHRPGLASRLGLPAAPGLADVLAGSASLQRVVQPSGLNNLAVLTAGRAADGSGLLLASEAMRSVLRHLRERYDWVLVDAPCWDGRPEVVALGSACDAVYLVLPHNQADTPAISDLLHLIPQQGSRLRGCVLLQS